MSVNPTSGSVLIRYHGQIEQVLAQAATIGLVELLEVTTDLPFLEPIAEQLISRLGDMDQTISKRTQGALDGRSALLAGLLVAAIVQAFRGSLLGPAIPLLWSATQAMGSGLPARRPQPPALENPDPTPRAGSFAAALIILHAPVARSNRRKNVQDTRRWARQTSC